MKPKWRRHLIVILSVMCRAISKDYRLYDKPHGIACNVYRLCWMAKALNDGMTKQRNHTRRKNLAIPYRDGRWSAHVWNRKGQHLNKEYKLWSSFLCNYLHPFATSCLTRTPSTSCFKHQVKVLLCPTLPEFPNSIALNPPVSIILKWTSQICQPLPIVPGSIFTQEPFSFSSAC